MQINMKESTKLNTHFLPNNFIIIGIKILFFFITLSFADVFSNAQQLKNESSVHRYRAIHWTIDKGLSVNTGFCMIKDIKGFLWIGTQNGLNRFDENV